MDNHNYNIYKDKVNKWLNSEHKYYELKNYEFVDILYDIMIEWMIEYKYVARFNDNDELYNNFVEMIYCTTYK